MHLIMVSGACTHPFFLQTKAASIYTKNVALEQLATGRKLRRTNLEIG